jgi:N-acetylneuraminate synthase
MGKVFIIAEIGINHNGDLGIARQLIDLAVFSGCDAVKFQKRTVEKVYTKELLDSPRESPWGTTQRAQKLGLEFTKEQYDEIDKYCRQKNIQWFASAWDSDALEFLAQYQLKYNKIASAMLGNIDFLKQVIKEKKYTFISTGMCTMDEVAEVVSLFQSGNCPFELMHCISTYPSKNEHANLRVIHTLKNKFDCNVGYSGHETGLQLSISEDGFVVK